MQAQSRQGLIQAITPIGLLLTLIATIAVSLYTSYINGENNRRFQESLNNNNNNPAPAPAPAPRPVAISQFISILIKVPGAGAGINIRLTRRQRQAPIIGQTNAQGEFRTSVLRNVPIEVTISGKIDDDNVIDVTQRITPSSTAAEFVIPTFKKEEVEAGTYKVILSWSSTVLDLDLAALRRVDGSCNCLHFFGGEEGSSCGTDQEVLLDEDNILSTGIEVLTIQPKMPRSIDSSDAMPTIYDIFVHNPEEVPSIARSGAIITVFGQQTSANVLTSKSEIEPTSLSVNVPTSDPNSNSLFWLAGSLNLETGILEPTSASESFADLTTEGDCTELIEQAYGGI
ncbi:uncharacterized protein LOC131877961 [Tigriopus californicus]|uniref:uncharacterized protein LOC131877961 n=1 Tax=Tigriopus californicus TaxID=6832 RepID=UPI0027DA19F8|nr:uncharacterized protein LOC131877961 [Tigriopus californicus]